MQFRLPDVGEGITESVLVKWHVIQGQSVREDDTLCVIETDKAVVEIPAPCTGTVVSLDVPEGTRILVGTVIAQVEPETGSERPVATTNAGAAAAIASAREPVAAATMPTVNAGSRTDVNAPRAMPSTRRHASELHVDIAKLTGSGPKGRILRSDVTAAAFPSGDAETSVQPETPTDERTPMSNLRRAIADNMRRSVALIPHATSSFRCDAAAFVELKERLQATLGQRVSFTAMLMKAMLPALKGYPFFNASVDDESFEIVTHRLYHIAFATHTTEGLIVPVVRDVDRKSLADVSGEIDRLAALARERRIKVADLRGGTITLSNIGSHGGHEVGGRPIINHPQVAVIAVGRIRPEAAVCEKTVIVRPTIYLTVSFDHRLIDGAYASGFMERFIAMIETPAMLLAYA